ncbi:YhjD/YihY/BrkB family envelope integrity protein [Geovibrio thiophilus]|nr:YhjD/YihY/BrkB family envelope integrity protein [Geovibrio thiophilus]
MKNRTPFIQKFYIACSRYMENELTNHAGAVAYYFLLSIIPIILLMLTIFESFLDSHAAFSEDFFRILGSFSPNLDREFLARFGLSGSVAGAVGIFGALNLLWTSRLILASVQRAFDVIFPSPKSRNFIITAFISIVIIPAVFLLVTFFAGLRLVLGFISGMLMQAGAGAEIIGRLGGLGFILPVIAAFAGAFVCYRYLPVRRPSTPAALSGALLFAFLLFVLKFAFGFMTGMAKMNILYGVIGALIALLLWVYVVCQVFFICAEFTYVCDRTDILVINKVFSVHKEEKRNIFERFFFGHNSSVMKRYSDFYPQGRELFRQGDTSREVYYVYKGSVDIYLEGIEKPVGTVREGDILGEMANLLGTPRTATAVAGTDSVIFRIEPDAFSELIGLNHRLSLRIINSLCERLKDMDEKLYL